MAKFISAGLISGLLLAAVASPGLAGQQPAMSDQDIINQLKLEPDSSRGLGHIDHVAPPSHVVESAYGVKDSKDVAQPTAKSGKVAAVQGSWAAPILFDLNSAQIRPESLTLLTQMSRVLNSPELKDTPFEVQGHTDSTGSPEFNKELSEQRAQAVRSYLVANGGVSADRLTAIGKGDSELAVPASPLAAENRRVLLVNRGS